MTVNPQQMEPIFENMHQHFSGWHVGLPEGFERKNEEIWGRRMYE